MISGSVSVFPCSTFNEPGAMSASPVIRLAVLWILRLRYLLNTIVCVCVWCACVCVWCACVCECVCVCACVMDVVTHCI